MTGTSRMLIEQRFNIKANSLLAVCLFVGIAGGWLLRGSRNAAVAGSAATANITASTKMDASKASQPPSPVRVKEMADTQAGPLVDKLKSDPNNPDLLTNIGNLYYDTKSTWSRLTTTGAHSGTSPLTRLYAPIWRRPIGTQETRTGRLRNSTRR